MTNVLAEWLATHEIKQAHIAGTFFHSVPAAHLSASSTWGDNTICECGAPLHAHAHLIHNASVPPVLPLGPPAAPLPLGFSLPLIPTFRGLPAVIQGSTGTRRLASIARTVPHGAFVAATVNHSGPRRQYPGALQPPPTMTVLVVVWPMVLPRGDYEPPGYPAPPIKLKNTHAKRYAEHFKKHGLVFDIKLAQEGPASIREFGRDVKSSLEASDLFMVPSPESGADDSVADDLDSQPWVILKAAVRGDVYTLDVHPSINDNTFGYAEFCKLNKKFANPLPNDTKPWIFLAPRFGHILGPVASFSTPEAPLHGRHPCLGQRVLDGPPSAIPASRSDPLDIECYADYCPSSTQTGDILSRLPAPPGDGAPRPSTPPNQSLVRQRSPASQLVQHPCDECAQGRQSQSILTFVPVASDDDEDDDPSPPLRPPLPPLCIGEDVLTPATITEWRDSIKLAVQPLPSTINNVYIKGKTVRAVSACLVDLLVYSKALKSDGSLPFKMADAVLCAEIISCRERITIESFFLPIRMPDIASSRRSSTGDGVERTVMREAAFIIAQQHNFWLPTVASMKLFRPALSQMGTPLPLRIHTFTAHGTFLALHCFLLGHGPLPISIWVVLALILGQRSMIIPRTRVRMSEDMVGPYAATMHRGLPSLK
ncbi:hypothetical protein FB451DRAFT_1443184 [Mycena latifolia]|nr:hypothetical protein FB451DRAFT_1443184 [Mycena latifolia]